MSKPLALVVLIGVLVAIWLFSAAVMTVSTVIAMFINSLFGIRGVIESLPMVVFSSGAAMSITLLAVKGSEKNGK